VTIVVDASVVVAALALGDADGAWAEAILAEGPLAAPHLMPIEVANILRRSAMAGDLTEAVANAAHGDLLALPIDLHAYEAVAERAWQLRKNLTLYDATYVALAEALAAPFATLDRKLARASGPRCEIRTPP
jgi:predicted nucleic acid-binding protein